MGINPIMSNANYSPEGDGAPLTDKLRVAIAKHLNQDHLEDMLACVKGIAGLDWAEQAQVVGLDAAGIDLAVSGGGNAQTVRIDFPSPANGVLAFQRIVGALIAEGRTELGWEVAADDN